MWIAKRFKARFWELSEKARKSRRRARRRKCHGPREEDKATATKARRSKPKEDDEHDGPHRLRNHRLAGPHRKGGAAGFRVP